MNPEPVKQGVEVLRLAQIDLPAITGLLERYGLVCEQVGADTDIPGSFWGDEEAGLIENRLLARADTPIHSILHEACHYVCMTPDRRDGLHTDAGGGYEEENGVCYLQILLAGYLPAVGHDRMMQDMDAWGYSFRLGSARDWFERDAGDAFQWLLARGLVDESGAPAWTLCGGSL
ncbi:MAG: hypothetical protein BMS9Abin09_0555 [Gammaproteobacteria bacterium]|nr:MAG: hypothetical protein BMS9Abin09_0555 [Gammaproteobacteria bacterium]